MQKPGTFILLLLLFIPCVDCLTYNGRSYKGRGCTSLSPLTVVRTSSHVAVMNIIKPLRCHNHGKPQICNWLHMPLHCSKAWVFATCQCSNQAKCPEQQTRQRQTAKARTAYHPYCHYGGPQALGVFKLFYLSSVKYWNNYNNTNDMLSHCGCLHRH